MLFTPAALLSLPLLATAAPAGLTFQQYTGSDVLSGENKLDVDQTWGIDLNELRLVQFGADEPPVWMSEADKIKAKAEGKRFMDITETPTLGISTFFSPSAITTRYAYPTPGNHSTYIKDVYKSFSLDEMKSFLTKFTSFRTRYYRSDTGKQSQKWLLSQIEEITKSHKGMSVKEFPHSWGQNSIIVRFDPAQKGDGKGKDVKGKDEGPITVIGAHQDSANSWPFLPAPGADDDGSGTTSSLTALRALADAKFTPETPVEFHYFSAEEGGLLGSQGVAKAYEDKGIKVKAMLQMDMTGWIKQNTEESVGIIQDFVDPDLTEFLEELVGAYLAIPAVKTKCGYACSDHSSFSKAGYQSSFAIESTFENSNHHIHTSDDTMNHPEFSFTHMREFSKLAVAFAVELGGVANA